MLELELGLRRVGDGNRVPLNVLCLGAHADDIEIGAGGTLLSLLSLRPGCRVTWVVASGNRVRAKEAGESATTLLKGLAEPVVVTLGQRDGYLDRSGPAVKEVLEEVRRTMSREPDLIFTHYRYDRHQDHRTISDLTWNLWRDHTIFEYEIPKWDGDLGTPNVFVELSTELVERKLAHLGSHFASQRGKDWYDEETLRALLRLRGVECRSRSKYAEAFYGRKLPLAL